eukprot:6191902-Pleurochrysis_carterae.AAC.1
MMQTPVLQVKVNSNGKIKMEHASNKSAMKKVMIDKSLQTRSTSNLVRPTCDINKKVHCLRVGWASHQKGSKMPSVLGGGRSHISDGRASLAVASSSVPSVEQSVSIPRERVGNISERWPVEDSPGQLQSQQRRQQRTWV